MNELQAIAESLPPDAGARCGHLTSVRRVRRPGDGRHVFGFSCSCGRRPYASEETEMATLPERLQHERAMAMLAIASGRAEENRTPKIVRALHIMNDKANPPDAAVWMMRCGCIAVVDEETGELTPDGIDFVGDDRLTVGPDGRIFNTDIFGQVDYVTCERCAESVTP